MDLFTTRAMIAALDERRAVRNFLTSRFFGRVENHTTLEVDIDIRRNKRRLAPFVNPLSEGKLMEHQGFGTMAIRPPYIKPKMVTTAADLYKRAMGVNVYGAQSPAAVAAAKLAEELDTMDSAIDRRIEWMAAKALFTGSVTVVGEGLNAVIDFQRNSTHNIALSGTDLWSNSASTPIEDLRAWKSVVSASSGVVPTMAIFASDVVDAFLRHADVRAVLNLLNNTTIAMRMDTEALAEQGVTYVGRVEQLDIFQYDEVFLNDTTGLEEPLVPAGSVLLGSGAVDARLHYGAILDLSGLNAVGRFPKSWVTEDPSARWVMVQSAPLPVPHQIDGFLVADVL
jgi:hypothetical protein